MTFIYSQPFIHHFTGLFETNTVKCNTYLALGNNVSNTHKIIFPVPLILA